MTDELGKGSYRIDVDKTKADASIKGFESSVKKSGDAVEKAVGTQATGAVNKLKTSLAGITKGGGIGGALLGGAGIGAGLGVVGLATKGIGMVTDFLGDASKAASDLSETQGKLSIVFKTQAGVIRDWAKDSAQSMGLSTQAALEAAGTFGNFLQAMGTTEEQAASMSETMVQLASDLGALNNTSAEDALAALQSGLSGESEPMKRFGVDISDAAVSAQLLADGVKKVHGAFTQAEKITGRYELILKQTTTAQGNFVATNKDTAGAAKVTAAEMDNLKANTGAFANVLQGLWSRTMGAAIELLDQAVVSVGDFIDMFNPGAKQVRDWVAELEKLPGAASHSTAELEQLALAAQVAGTGFQGAKDDLVEMIRWAQAAQKPATLQGLLLKYKQIHDQLDKNVISQDTYTRKLRQLAGLNVPAVLNLLHDNLEVLPDDLAALVEQFNAVAISAQGGVGPTNEMAYSLAGLAASVADPVPADIAALAGSVGLVNDAIVKFRAAAPGSFDALGVIIDNVKLLQAHFKELPPAMQEAMRFLGVAVDEGVKHVSVAMHQLPIIVAHAVVDMKKTIQDGKKGIIDEFRDLAWQSKHPFAEVNYAKWLQHQHDRAMKLSRQAVKDGRPGLAAQYKGAADDAIAEMNRLPGVAARVNARVVASITGAATSILGFLDIFGNGPTVTYPGHGHHRAMGGPVDAFQPVIVGERGPELYVPRAAGTVIPADRTAQLVTNHGPSYVVNVNAPMRPVEPADIGRQMRRLAMMGAPV